tara:strand:- start:6909 stop:8030 length:1122 start_codon:yes stop_codon:yes gene_type:complete
MSTYDRAMGQIERGREGSNQGIPIPFDRLRKFLPNIQQKTYYLVGAGTKVGKTSLADDIFFYGAYDYIKSNPDSGMELDIDYFSYEIDSETKIIKGIGRKLWHDYGIIASANDILSRGENWCSDEIYQLVREYREYFNEMEDMVTVHDMPDNPTGMNKYLINKARQHGTTTLKNIQTDTSKEPIMRFESYKPDNDNRYWIQIVDHIALMKEERSYNTKQNIDKMSQYFVQLRNNYRATPVVIQQLAFDSESDERYKQQRLTPTLRDFGDSKYTTRDANVIMALFSPLRYGLEKFQGYDVASLGNTYRNLEILENRDGEPNINVGLNFVGPVGTFRELPPANEMAKATYEYAAGMVNGRSKYKSNKDGIWEIRE